MHRIEIGGLICTVLSTGAPFYQQNSLSIILISTGSSHLSINRASCLPAEPHVYQLGFLHNNWVLCLLRGPQVNLHSWPFSYQLASCPSTVPHVDYLPPCLSTGPAIYQLGLPSTSWAYLLYTDPPVYKTEPPVYQPGLLSINRASCLSTEPPVYLSTWPSCLSIWPLSIHHAWCISLSIY
jgi:hypothetical protein